MLRSPKSEEKREAILQAAVVVIAKNGVHGATTRKIAAEAGINLATLHYQFENKEAILLSVLGHLASKYRQNLEQTFARPEPLRDRIERLLTYIWGEVQKNPHEQLTLFDLTLYALTTPGSEWMGKKKYDEYLVLYRDALASSSEITAGSLEIDVDALTNFIFTGFIGLVLQWLATANTPRARQQLQTLITAAQRVFL
ncbi:TetR/AcrR family transcriptional regulator [Azospirillum griseum]|uniref:TetR/AcrR family transcriptional regulator n=1 Tax=Azospirillum griseum TaxID=2496639 RepID=UPI001FED0325|nr:TetR/AcrR family transcriptional regulator [Azospirillum griseum]